MSASTIQYMELWSLYCTVTDQYQRTLPVEKVRMKHKTVTTYVISYKITSKMRSGWALERLVDTSAESRSRVYAASRSA